MRHITSRAFFIVISLASLAAAATTAPSTKPAAAPASPQVLPDGRVTFRLTAPTAKTVSVGGTLSGKMHRGAKGLWSLTVGPVLPNIYYYTFMIDGATVSDPQNRWNHNGGQSLVLVPTPKGAPAQPWEITNVPHGSVQVGYYTSTAMPGRVRRCHVYLPPGYDARADRTYPTFYLLHGHGDDDSSWTNTGRANFILDNLIADGTVPMVVVMPDGGSLDTMPTATFVDDVLHDLIPFIEKQFRVRTTAADRAVAGLSMGGGHAMHLAFDHPGIFSAVGIWSPGWRDCFTADLSTLLPRLIDSPKAFSSLNFIDLACGRSDRLLPVTESLDAWLSRAGLRHTEEVTQGSHAWTVWRAALIRFAPRLFKHD